MIHDEAGRIERISGATSTAANDAATTNADTSTTLVRLPGSSSASCLGDTVVTTCALVDDPTVLSVSLIQGKSSPIMMELDLGHTKVFGVPVKIQCFSEGYSTFILRLVDTRGIVLSVTLDSSLTPESLKLLSVPHLVEAELGYFSGATLESSMVTFLSSNVIIMGLAPNLLAVNLAAETIDIWSQAQTLEEMKSKRLGHIFSKASDLLLGRPEDDDVVMDMPPVAAVCQTGGLFVFSLHSDASIRRWRVDNDQLIHPTEVLFLKVDAIPSPDQWSDSKGAIALCAQLYSSVYALAIHVQTIGDDENKSPCQLVVVHGSQDEEEGGDLVKSVLSLSVPKEATSLVGLDLAKERCRLTALFQTLENDTNSTLFVTYPPSIVSIVSNEPIVTPQENTLDGVAASERARLTGLAVPVTGSTLEQDLHAVDTAFLKYLFRPAFSRVVVTPPSHSCVRAAIRKLVPGHYTGEAMSIELETLRAMHEWRRMDSLRATSPVRRSAQTSTAVASTPGGSVYDAYARQDPEGTPEMDIDDSFTMEKEEEDMLDQERAAQVEAQELRWRELLLAVWTEEERLRDPLCLSNFLSTGSSNFVLVRAGVTSLLKEVDAVDYTSSTWEDLDKTAMILLGRVENKKEWSAMLKSNEAQLYEETAKASLALSTGTVGGWATNLSDIGKMALTEVVDDEINLDGVALALREVSQEDTLDWLQSVDSLVSLGFPGASVLPDRADVLDDDTASTWSNRIADCQTRLAASGLFVQCTDSVRRLALARFMLLSGLGSDNSSFGGSVLQAALRQYLYSLSVLWTCAQQVPMPSSGLFGRNRNIDLGNSSPSDSPPTKRFNAGETTSSILADGSRNTNVTTALDARFIQLSQEHNQSLYEAGSLDGPIVTMVRICLNSAFAAAPSGTLPELGVLPTPSDDSGASDYPRLALRLITPFYADPPLNEDQDMLLARKEALAECLLIEANAESQKGPASDSLVNALQLKACDLLSPSSSENTTPSVEHNLLETVFRTLTRQSQVVPEFEPDMGEVERSEMALADELQLLLMGFQGRPGTEIKRLCQQPTVRTVFLPLMMTERKSFFRSLEELSRASVKSLAQVLLRISKLMYRLSILERHSGSVGILGRSTSPGKNDFLLSYIEEAIREVQSLLPSSVYNSMAEYASLWTLLFNHSVSSRRWRTAHNVCVSHPVPERRVENHRRLVIAMVNAGSLSELIDLCAIITIGDDSIDSLDGESGACVDFYEIAAETLAVDRPGDPYESGSVSTDFLGCLYALHASRGRWDRAAQAMDAKYSAALKALSSSIDRGTRLANVVNVNAAADDLVLSSLFCSNAVQSIVDPSKRFLVSDEVGPFSGLPVAVIPENAAMESDVSNKRGRGGLGWTTPQRVDNMNDSANNTRLSRFMTIADLNARSARAMALWIFLRDQKCDPAEISLSTIEVPSVEGDRALIDRLAILGYYEHVILLAKAIDDQHEERGGGGEPGGRSLLEDAILHVLSFVLPVALNGASRCSSNDMETDVEMPRPSFLQLRRVIEEAGDSSDRAFSFVLGETWYTTTELPTIATAAAAEEYTRKLTTEYSNASSPLVLEVAAMYLDIDPSGASMPLWLERFLLGIKEDSVGDSSGLFAHKATVDGSYSGDPAGLVELYTRRGLYSKACDIVSVILGGALVNETGAQSREMRAPARLPEKGDTDFVPYTKIDVLSDLVNRTLSNPGTGSAEKAALEESRKSMEAALEKHFELMKISEQGMRSARALTQ